VLLVGFEPTTMTKRVNAPTTELQSPYFSMYSYSIYVYGITPRYPEQYLSTSTLLLCVNRRDVITLWGDSTTQELIQIADLAIAIKDPKDLRKHKSKLKWTGPIFFHLGMNFTWDVDNTLCISPYQIH
jgi:hypothetical protein